jgi:hypothetical protein
MRIKKNLIFFATCIKKYIIFAVLNFKNKKIILNCHYKEPHQQSISIEKFYDLKDIGINILKIII